MNIEIDPDQLPALLFSMRKQRSFSRDEVAKLCGVSEIQIYNIEKGNHTPSFKTLKKLFSAYKFSVRLQISDLVQQKIEEEYAEIHSAIAEELIKRNENDKTTENKPEENKENNEKSIENTAA